ncbi:MAG: hypothetical protein LIO95_10035 [Clostridiales bacterium]|nr:hypothetical protein [Clostridiales bacterium]
MVDTFWHVEKGGKWVNDSGIDTFFSADVTCVLAEEKHICFWFDVCGFIEGILYNPVIVLKDGRKIYPCYYYGGVTKEDAGKDVKWWSKMIEGTR